MGACACVCACAHVCVFVCMKVCVRACVCVECDVKEFSLRGCIHVGMHVCECGICVQGCMIKSLQPD